MKFVVCSVRGHPLLGTSTRVLITSPLGRVGRALLLCVLAGAPASAQQLDTAAWGVDNNVNAVVRHGNTVYVAGAFSRAGPNSGCAVGVDRTSAKLIPALPKVAGVLNAVIPDGHGGWYIGGALQGVGGLERPGVARILSDGTVSDWTPGCDGRVLCLALRDGRLFVGGQFTRIGGESRANLAELDVNSGHATAWNPGASNRVLVLAPTDSTLLVGGEFTSIGGVGRGCIAELDLETGDPTAWNPDAELYGYPASVRAIAAIGDTVLVGGMLGSIGGQNCNNLAAVSAATGLALAWAPVIEGYIENRYDGASFVSALVPADGTVYVGGHFAFVNGVPRGGLAEIDLATGQATLWDPNPSLSAGLDDISVTVTALAAVEQSLYVAGTFRYVGGQPRTALAEVNRSSGAVSAWDPRADTIVDALAVSGNVLFAGGRFALFGNWERRINIAAFDATTGTLKNWIPNPDGPAIYSLAAHDGRIFVGGVFGRIGEQPRSYLAALDTLTGAALEWAPNANGNVDAMQVAGDRLYIGGHFTSIADSARLRAASFELASGQLTSWNPGVTVGVSDLQVRGGTVYLGGSLRAVGGVSRRFLAAVDASSGAVLDWNPNPDSFVEALAVGDSTVYVGGSFKNIGGQARGGFAAVDAVTGVCREWSADAWHPNASFSRVYALALAGDTLYVGGSFYSLGGQARSGMAALDAATGEVLPWDPAPGDPSADYPLEPGVIWALRAYDDALYVGGRFRYVGTIPSTTFAGFSIRPKPAPPPVPPETPSVLVLNIASPVGAQALIRFALPRQASVTLGVFDLQGRRVAVVLAREQLPAGSFEIPIRTTAWANGFYFCRIEASGETATRKLLVLR